MTRITRYLISDLLKVFLVALAGMTVLMLIVGLAQEAVRHGLGPTTILRLIPYAMPNALRFAVPGTMLFAACSVYGRMSASNEIIALKSQGISPMRVITPALGLAFFISLFAVWLNDIAVSWGRQGMERVVLHSLEQIIYGTLRTQRSYSTNRFSVTVKGVEGRKLLRPMIYFRSDDNKPEVMLNAEHAELKLDAAQGMLKIEMTNGEISVGDKVTFRFPNTIEREIPLTDASRKGGPSGSPSNYPMWLLGPERSQQQEEIVRLRRDYALESAYAYVTGDLSGLVRPQWAARQQVLSGSYARLHRLQTEPWRRWANGFSCLFFVLVGAPLSIRLRNSDLWTSFAAVFLPILVLYYPLLAYGVDRAKAGELPPTAVWLGNILLAIAGVWLIRKTIRY